MARHKTTSRLSTDSWLASTVNGLASFGPSFYTLFRFHDLVAQPVSALAVSLPIVASISIFPLLIAGKTSLAGIIHVFGALVLLFVPATYIVVILMGAPFTTHVAQTLLFAAHLATMTFTRAISQLGLDKRKWIPLLPYIPDTAEISPSKTQAVDARVGGTGLEGIVWGTLAGAYLGAVPIPLDWDREWQKWPVTVHLGACIGLALGSTCQLLYNWYTQHKNESTKLTTVKKNA